MTKIRAWLPLVMWTLGCILVEGAFVVGFAYLGGTLLFHLVSAT
jgi:hypothetical protein